MSANNNNNLQNNNNNNDNNNQTAGNDSVNNENYQGGVNVPVVVRPKIIVASDTGSIKSETSSICRPLKLGQTSSSQDCLPAIDGNGNQILTDDQVNNNKKVYNPCEQGDGTGGSRSTRFPTLGQCSRGQHSQDSERTVCCDNLAVMLYQKALESAKRALPIKSKQRSGQQFPRSFGEDFESIGPEGFNYLDDGQTECSYDYRDIDYNRDSIVRPDVLAGHMSAIGLPVGSNDDSVGQPENLSDMRHRYGMPDEPNRVQPYVSPGIVPQVVTQAVVLPLATRPPPPPIPAHKSVAKSEVAINKDSDITTDRDDISTNTVESGIIVKQQDKTSGSAKSPPNTSITNNTTVPKTTITTTVNNQELKGSKSRPMIVALPSGPISQPQTTVPTPVEPIPMRNVVKTPEDIMDSMAKRTSQLIIDRAIHESVGQRLSPIPGDRLTETIDNTTNESKLDGKLAIDSADKEVAKRERKLQAKRQKEEEKHRRKSEKQLKDEERKERKSLFDRFRSDDRQKREIQRKQKQFEKIRAKSAAKKASVVGGDRLDGPVDIEADDEYEPSPAAPVGQQPYQRYASHKYEDIDANVDKTTDDIHTSGSNLDTNVKVVVNVEPVGDNSQPLVAKPVVDVVKYEFIENIREIGVTYVPSPTDYASGSDTDVPPEATDGSRKSSKNSNKRRTKKSSTGGSAGVESKSSFRVLKSKVRDLLPANKWTPKVIRKAGKADKTHVGQQSQQAIPQIVVLPTGGGDLQDGPQVAEVVNIPSPTPTPTDFQREYENITDESMLSTGGAGDQSNTGLQDMSTATSGTSDAVTVVTAATTETSTGTDRTARTGRLGSLSQYETEEDEDQEQQFLERVSRVNDGSKGGRKKHRQSKARAKLNQFTAKAMESLPKITAVVRDLVTPRSTGPTKSRDLAYERYRQMPTRYDSDFDCVSDSELCDTLHRRSAGLSPAGARHHVYEEMAATQERLDSYMSPVSGPLRPPRRFSGMKYTTKVQSSPTLSTQPMVRVPKRIPPPRPPPPTPRPSIVVSEGESMDDLRHRYQRQRVPANIFYTNVRLNYKPKRRFINGRIRQGLADRHKWATSQPNSMGGTYDAPKPPIPVGLLRLPPGVRVTVRPPTRIQVLNALNSGQPIDPYGCYRSQTLPTGKDVPLMPGATGATRNWRPTPPPRRRRSAQRSHYIDPTAAALDWQPFTWKWRRCRSETELDVRDGRGQPVATPVAKNNQLIINKIPSNGPPLQPKIIKIHNKRPTRPPPPSISYSLSTSALSTRYHPSSDHNSCQTLPYIDHIYTSVCKGPEDFAADGNQGVNQRPNDWSRRPLPPPPRPPKPQPRRPSTTRPATRDVSIGTNEGQTVTTDRCDQETQLDARNNSLWEDMNGNDMLDQLAGDDQNRTPTNPLTPTTPTNQQYMFPGQLDMDQLPSSHELDKYRCDSPNTLTVSSSTRWYDVDEPPAGQPRIPVNRDWDQETINDDVSSIASNYQSFASEYTAGRPDGDDIDDYGYDRDREETPVAEVVDVPDVEGPLPQRQSPVQSDYTPTASKTAIRSQSVRTAPPIPSAGQELRVSPVRHSMPANGTTGGESGPTDRKLIDNRMSSTSSGLTSDRPDSVISTESSLHEKLMTNTSNSSSSDEITTINGAGHTNNSATPQAPPSVTISHALSLSSLSSQTTPHDSSASDGDGDDYSLSSSDPNNSCGRNSSGGQQPGINESADDFKRRKNEQKLYYIARELYSSEEVFVDVLHLLDMDFRAAVDQHLPEDVLQSILKLLPQLRQINEQLVKDLKERIDDWPNHQRISDVLVKICPFLKQYSLYIRDFEQITQSYDEALRRYPTFAVAVKEFQSTPRCQKLSVKHFMLKPVQRLPQYKLLLQDYLHHLSPESPDYDDTQKALAIVSQVAEHANNSMKSSENLSKLLQIQNSIIGGAEVIKPSRVFIKEGELMKLSRKGMQDRWFILFNDCLMYLTAVQNCVYRVNHELSLTGMRVSLPQQQDFQNEFSVISQSRSFSLAARSTKEREEWVTELNKAIKENTKKRISFAKSGSMCSDQSLVPALQLGMVAPVWIPDARVTMCQSCASEFSVTFRRHHCRCCGKVVCNDCSQNKAPLLYNKNRIARVCDECFEKLREQMEKLDMQMKHSSDVSLDALSIGGTTGGSSTTGGCASASDTDDSGWSGLKEWPQLFARNLIRKSERKVKHRYVPSVLKEVSANDVGSLISGYLHRRESRKNWKNYWFVIKDMVLYTYRASEDVAALKSEPLLGFKVERLRDAVDGIDGKLLVQLSHPGQPTMIFRAETVGSAERWFQAMQTATTLD